MTASVEAEALKAKIQQWRDAAEFDDAVNSQYAAALDRCADELAALIAAGLSEAPQVNPRIMKLISRASHASGYLCENEDDVIGKQIGEDLWNAVEAVTSSDASVAGDPQETTGLSEAPAPQEQQPICVACSGCGWCEGSPAFTCPVCKGAGHVH